MRESELQTRDILVMKSGKVPKQIYFVKSKTLKIGSVDTMTKYITLGPGGVFGEAHALFNCPLSYSLLFEPRGKIESGAETYTVEAQEYLDLLKLHPDMYKLLREDAIIKRRMYRQMKRQYLAEHSNISYIIQNKIMNKSGDFNSQQNISGISEITPVYKGDQTTIARNKKNEDITLITNKNEGETKNYLFGNERSKYSHKQILLMEYEYNSEDEYGLEDIFEKEEPPKVKDTISRKVREFEGRIKKLQERFEKLGSQTQKFLELSNNA